MPAPRRRPEEAAEPAMDAAQLALDAVELAPDAVEPVMNAGTPSAAATGDPGWRPATAERPAVEIVRSARRRRSASAGFVDDRIVVRVPAGLDAAEETELIDRVLAKVVRQHRAVRTADDTQLLERAHRLADRYLDGVRPASVTWSTRMRRLHGSCSVASGRIRLSAELAQHPDWVLDAVLIHELAHLVEPNHSPAFHALADRYPDQARAQAYLEGFQAGRFARARADQDPPTASGPSLPGESDGPAR